MHPVLIPALTMFKNKTLGQRVLQRSSYIND